jgi:hypothetical protein
VKLQETTGVVMKNENNPADADVMKGFLDRIVKKIREEENVEELGRLRSLIRSRVPLFLRSYVTAYLLKSLAPMKEAAAPVREQGGGKRAPGRQRPRGDFSTRAVPPQSGRAASPQPGRSALPQSGRAAPPQPGRAAPPQSARAASPQTGRAAAQEGKLIQLFVSIGRNRRVFPRDLSDFFVQRLNLRAEEIGRVRVFDKYSFVEVSQAKAQEAITRLTGADFKGRTITVNFAKKKEEI